MNRTSVTRVGLLVSALVVLAGCDTSTTTRESAGAPDVEIGRGHADIGPQLVDGSLTLGVKDDATSPPRWLPATTTSIRVHDAGRHAVPDDPAYAFLGQPGEEIWVIPQTQQQDVIWLGWNTQEPQLLASSPSAVTLSVVDVEGPDDMTIYFDYGGFRAPEVIWDGAGEQGLLTSEMNVHAHANWVFGSPGRYRVELLAQVTDRDGEVDEATATVVFAVGDAA